MSRRGPRLDLPRMQRQIIRETFVEGRKRAEVAPRLGISANTNDTTSRRRSARLRRASGKTGERCTSEGERCTSQGERCTSQGERSNSEGERSNSEGERGKTDGAGSNSVGDAHKAQGDARSDRVHRGNIPHDRDKSGSHAA